MTEPESPMTIDSLAQKPWPAIIPAVPFLPFDATYIVDQLILVDCGSLREGLDTEPEDPEQFDEDWLMDCQDYYDLLALMDMTGNLDAMS